MNNLPVGVMVYKKTQLEFASHTARRLFLGKSADQPLNVVADTVEQSAELKTAFGFQSNDPMPNIENLALSSEHDSSSGSRDIPGSQMCTYRDKTLCITAMTLGLTNASNTKERFKVCIVQDQTVYDELRKEKVAKQYMKNFFAMISHELRNPLHGLLGMFENMIEQFVEGDMHQQFMMGISTVKLMMQLTNDILDLSQLESNSFRLVEEEVNAHKLIKECVEIMQYKYKMKGVSLYHKESRLYGRIWCDKNRYMQMLLNLLGNALKFTENGEVWVLVRYDREEGKLYTSVKDSGIGIRDEDKQKLFSLFGKLDDHTHMNPQGSGLGLHICKKLAEAMGGTVELESEYTKGTTITFSILNKKKASELDNAYSQVSIPNEALDNSAISSSYLSILHSPMLLPSVHDSRSPPDTRTNRPEELAPALVVDDEMICVYAARAHLKYCAIQADAVSCNLLLSVGNNGSTGDRGSEKQTG